MEQRVQLVVDVVEIESGQVETHSRWRKNDIARRAIVNGMRACGTALVRRTLREGDCVRRGVCEMR